MERQTSITQILCLLAAHYRRGDNALMMGACRMFTIRGMPSNKSCDEYAFDKNQHRFSQ
jgi:hypothetical protein